MNFNVKIIFTTPTSAKWGTATPRPLPSHSPCLHLFFFTGMQERSFTLKALLSEHILFLFLPGGDGGTCINPPCHEEAGRRRTTDTPCPTWQHARMLDLHATNVRVRFLPWRSFLVTTGILRFFCFQSAMTGVLNHAFDPVDLKWLPAFPCNKGRQRGAPRLPALSCNKGNAPDRPAPRANSGARPSGAQRRPAFPCNKGQHARSTCPTRNPEDRPSGAQRRPPGGAGCRQRGAIQGTGQVGHGC
jgi:hypothetical protein